LSKVFVKFLLKFSLPTSYTGVNEKMPDFVASVVAEALNSQKKAMAGARVLILGVAYKPDVELGPMGA
jgi:UDP-N-acetyl-D-mannosaminuronate dehydrogenase